MITIKDILQKGKRYTVFDFIRIPFFICPGYTLIKITNKIISALIPSFQLLVTAKFVDTALDIFKGKTEYNNIFVPLALLAVIVFYNYLNWSLMSYVNLKSEMNISKVFRSAIVEKRSKLEYCHIENNDSWDLITRTCKDPVGKISGGLNNILSAADIVVRVFSILVILMTQVWWAGLLIIGFSIPLFFIAFKGGKETYFAYKEAEKHNRRAAYLHSVLSGRDTIEERALFGYSSSLNDKWYEQYETARKNNLKVNLKNFLRTKSASLSTVCISVLITGVLLFPLSDGTITSGMFIGLVTTILSLVPMMSWQLSDVTSQFANNREYLKDMTALMSLSETEGALDLPDRTEPIHFESIEFRNVSFKYPGTELYVLKNFSLYLQKNRHYAFVGRNGAGKTTITKLLTGLYREFEGDILINGKSIRDYKLVQLKCLFSVVYQDFARYSVPMKESISLDNTLDEIELHKVISALELDAVVDKMPNGIENPLGKIYENGVDLSGGEWQRVAIARSLFKQSEIQILDEPTAALDPVAESNVYELFGRISTDKTTVFITHRLGATRFVDEIVVIDGGRVSEQGSHSALMEKGGIYAEMYEGQRSWYQ